MYDHLSISVSDLDRAVAVYDEALAALGIVRLWRTPRAAGYGPRGFEGEAPFAIVVPKAGAASPSAAFHLAFSADSRAAVNQFHARAVAAGAVDAGPPGIRAHYDPGYYAAFIEDHDGNRLEAVVHEAQGEALADQESAS